MEPPARFCTLPAFPSTMTPVCSAVMAPLLVTLPPDVRSMLFSPSTVPPLLLTVTPSAALKTASEPISKTPSTPELLTTWPAPSRTWAGEAPVQSMTVPVVVHAAQAGGAMPASPAASTTVATVPATTLEPLRFPRPLVISETATQACVWAFQRVR
jgi:hypothetical protein